MRSKRRDRGRSAGRADSIEHGDGLTDALMDEMAQRGIYWCRRLPWASMLRRRGGNWPKMADLQRENFPRQSRRA